MPDKIVTKDAAHTDELLSAVESTLKHHNLRLKPGQDLAQVVDALSAKGVKLTAENGYLSASQTTAGVEHASHVNQIFEGFAKTEPDRFFPRDVAGISSRDQLDRAGKIKFIAEQGLPAWEKLPQTSQREVTVVLDKTKLTRAQYLSLDRTTRAQLAGQWGTDAIGRVMARTK
jgi:hypothetical protein